MKLPKTQLDILEDRFNLLKKMGSPQQRGREFEKFVKDLLNHFNIKTDGGFVRKDGSAQIDGTFWLGNTYYFVECKWEKEPCGKDKIFGLKDKIKHSPKVMNLFLSISGWTKSVVDAIKEETQRKIILMNGKDLDCVLSGDVPLKELLEAKQTHLLQHKEPYLGADEYLAKLKKQS